MVVRNDKIEYSMLYFGTTGHNAGKCRNDRVTFYGVRDLPDLPDYVPPRVLDRYGVFSAHVVVRLPSKPE